MEAAQTIEEPDTSGVVFLSILLTVMGLFTCVTLRGAGKYLWKMHKEKGLLRTMMVTVQESAQAITDTISGEKEPLTPSSRERAKGAAPANERDAEANAGIALESTTHSEPEADFALTPRGEGSSPRGSAGGTSCAPVGGGGTISTISRGANNLTSKLGGLVGSRGSSTSGSEEATALDPQAAEAAAAEAAEAEERTREQIEAFVRQGRYYEAVQLGWDGTHESLSQGGGGAALSQDAPTDVSPAEAGGAPPEDILGSAARI